MDLPKSIEECKYFTKRILDNGGYVIAWVFKNDDVLHIKYKCPYCGFEGEVEKEFKRPIRFRCQKCNKSILIKKLKK